ncbi:hypothetical protein BEWA_044320 [Theileria equi strain WA]|uniref:Cyclin-dependent kinases regulatory subunit n=1 Tax=Theileria equi strain WA TaxID=1537102 RepID=L1LGI6_THEEQ|nr:hypothetical protein BEWA_044320 [Theileria equi strain WA]EKX74389.1 hypothetical protein BEWA_044320 [Theileria equi strain WA]|eukprot:XP_004833841.1 hypothetical protein BEWA_044320 [Theileria equi strain WA]
MEHEDALVEFMRNFVTREISNDIEYSDKVEDGKIEMRWVLLPRNHPLFLLDPLESNLKRIFREEEWRSLGIKMSLGWHHCGFSPFEPNILIFQRKRT